MLERIKVSPFLTIDKRGPSRFFVKGGTEEFYIRRPLAEINGYKLLRPYLHVPRARIAQTTLGPILVVQGVDAPDAFSQLRSNPEVVGATVDSFLDDVGRMWENTAKPMDETQLGRDWRRETLATLNRLKEEPKIQAVSKKPVVVNGEKYPSVGKTLDLVEKKLAAGPDENMVLCHGDEHIENLLVMPDKGYMAIDPGNWTGFNTPASAVNNMVGAHTLFHLRYDGAVKAEGKSFEVDYKVIPPYDEADRILKKQWSRLQTMASSVCGGENLAKELLFVNQMRVGVGWVKRSMDLTEVLNTGMVYAGIATEQYYSKNIS
jgi:hypothetical protein